MPLSNSELHVRTLSDHLPEVFDIRATDIFNGWLVSPVDNVEAYPPIDPTQWPINQATSIARHPTIADFGSQGTNSHLAALIQSLESLGRYPGAPIPAEPSPELPIPPDAAAFYLPYHYYPTTWGIYLIVEKLDQMIQQLRDAAQIKGIDLSHQEASDTMQYFLYAHEAFHHNIECLATRDEVVFRKPFYKHGFQDYYDQYREHEQNSEEALANAYAYQKLFATNSRFRKAHRWAKGSETLRFLTDYFKDYFKRSPAGYNGATHYLTAKTLEFGEYTLAEGSWQKSIDTDPIPAPTPKPCHRAIWSAFPHALHGFANITSRVKYLIHEKSGRKQSLKLNWQPFPNR